MEFWCIDVTWRNHIKWKLSRHVGRISTYHVMTSLNVIESLKYDAGMHTLTGVATIFRIFFVGEAGSTFEIMD